MRQLRSVPTPRELGDKTWKTIVSQLDAVIDSAHAAKPMPLPRRELERKKLELLFLGQYDTAEFFRTVQRSVHDDVASGLGCEDLVRRYNRYTELLLDVVNTGLPPDDPDHDFVAGYVIEFVRRDLSITMHEFFRALGGATGRPPGSNPTQDAGNVFDEACQSHSDFEFLESARWVAVQTGTLALNAAINATATQRAAVESIPAAAEVVVRARHSARATDRVFAELDELQRVATSTDKTLRSVIEGISKLEHTIASAAGIGFGEARSSPVDDGRARELTEMLGALRNEAQDLSSLVSVFAADSCLRR